MVKVGDRYEHLVSMKYHDGGKVGHHTIRELVEVTFVGEYNAEYKVVQVLEEHNAPSWATGQIGSGGGFAIAYVDRTGSTFKKVE